MKKKVLNLFFAALALGLNSFAQEHEPQIQNYLNDHVKDLGITKTDAKNWKIYNQHDDKSSNISYVYLLQTHNNIEVFNAIANFAINENGVVLGGNRLVNDVEGKINTSSPSINQVEAISAACKALGIQQNAPAELIRTENGISLYKKGSMSQEDIPVKLVYVPDGDVIKLAWDLSIYELSGNHWWSIRIDATTGTEINKGDWVTSCEFDSDGHAQNSYTPGPHYKPNIPVGSPLAAPAPPPATDEYRVYALPTESPNHGPRTLVVGPSDATASPHGWHDISGTPGNEFTVTRGNNVRASEDENADDGFGYWPDGGATLSFDYPLNPNQAANLYWDAAITNLFYMNNVMHDVWYHYGFDEASGNFQANSYANGGLSSDEVYAEAQDGGGTNNANFATPVDGQNPRMQMYLWDAPADLLTINAPGGIAGAYMALPAQFGGAVPIVPLTTDIIIYDDNAGVEDYDACETAVNGAALTGNICIIRRGDCLFVDKVQNAQNAGAAAVIMVNNVVGAPPITMGGTQPSITIPSIMVSNADGEAMIAAIEGGATVNGTIVDAQAFALDGDFDNGIISHEYGHGISTRLTGGSANSSCLSNAEQMGEGWSDWFGLMLTIEPGDLATDNRGIGTFVTGEATNGFGIRPVPYNTDFAVNDFTYDASNWDGAGFPTNISEPHGIGFVWCTMLWDLSWALIDAYGYDADLYNGTGGNNIAMELVIQGLKLQPCGPGFVDGRDAILQADMLLNGGANQCLIWNVFANRGLGNSASQGSANSRTDQVEAFDMPPGFVNVTGSATVNACTDYTWAANGTTYSATGSYDHTLLSSTGCDSIATLNLTILNATSSTATVSSCTNYTWAANGQTYTADGLYAVTLVNAAGCDSIANLDLTINAAPSVSVTAFSDPTTCSGTEGTITIGGTGTGVISWTGAGTGNSGTVTTPYVITGLGSGNYSIVFDDGCPSSAVTQGLIAPGSTTSTVASTACVTYNWNGVDYTTSGAYTWTGTNSASCDSVATLNLTINDATTSSTDVTECDTYNWNGTDYTSSGSYTWTGTNALLCDSIATLNLTINVVDVSSSFVDDITLTADLAGATYAWVDCNDNYSLIAGATNQTYTALVNGDYAVIVTENGCSDTSACMNVNAVGILENNFGTAINVYPNPTNQEVTVDLGAEYSNIEVRVTNALGQIIDTKQIAASSTIDLTLDGARGTYILEIKADNGITARVRVVKN